MTQQGWDGNKLALSTKSGTQQNFEDDVLYKVKIKVLSNSAGVSCNSALPWEIGESGPQPPLFSCPQSQSIVECVPHAWLDMYHTSTCVPRTYLVVCHNPSCICFTTLSQKLKVSFNCKTFTNAAQKTFKRCLSALHIFLKRKWPSQRMN